MFLLLVQPITSYIEQLPYNDARIQLPTKAYILKLVCTILLQFTLQMSYTFLLISLNLFKVAHTHLRAQQEMFLVFFILKTQFFIGLRTECQSLWITSPSTKKE